MPKKPAKRVDTASSEHADTVVAPGTGDEVVVALRKTMDNQPRRHRPTVVVAPNYWRLAGLWENDLRMRTADTTQRAYRDALADFAAWMEARKLPLHVEAITRDHVRVYLGEMQRDRGLKPSTARSRRSGLLQFFKFLVGEGFLDKSPLEGVKAIPVKNEPRRNIADQQMMALLHACRGTDFLSRRDLAIIRVLKNTGIRRAELCSLRVDTVDLRAGIITITGKTGTRRYPIRPKTLRALSMYEYMRADHDYSELPNWWLTHCGGLAVDSVNYIINKRARQAGIEHVHPHLFRHTWVHKRLAGGMQEGDVASLAGHSGTSMIHNVYGRELAHERAMDAERRMNIDDEF